MKILKPLSFVIALVLASCQVATAQVKVYEVDVLDTDAGDGFLGLSELSTSSFVGTTLANVKGQSIPGDGGGGTYLWNGTSWDKVLLDDTLSASVDQTFSPAQKAKLAANWPEAVSSEAPSPEYTVVVDDAIADGTSHPLSDTYASIGDAQADFPAATDLSDETDWAAIQSALDTLNTVPGSESGGTIFMPPGDYVINKTITIKGPGVRLQGAGKLQTYLEFTPLTGTALRLGFIEGETYDTAGQSGSPRNVELSDFKFCHADPTNAGNTSTGFSTLTPLGGADFWYVIYLILNRVDFEGFDIATEFSNTPVVAARDCSITGKSRSVRTYKVDSISFFNCDLNGTYIPRNNVANNQIDYDDNINIECISADAGDMTSDGVFSGGGPTGAGFFMNIIGGELGHGKAVMRNTGLPVKILGSNVEDITNEWAFRLDGQAFLDIENCRMELRSAVDSDYSSFEEAILMDGTTGKASHPRLRLTNVFFSGLPDEFVVTATGDGIETDFPVGFDFFSEERVEVYLDDVLQVDPADYSITGSTITFTAAPGIGVEVKTRKVICPIVIRGNSSDRKPMEVWSNRSYRVDFQAATGASIYDLEKIGITKDSAGPRTISGDSDIGNQGITQGAHWINRTGVYGEDLITPYRDATGIYRRSSLLNHRAFHMLGQTTGDLSSSAGVDQELETYTVPQTRLIANGDKLKIFIAGSFAANANNKGFVLQFYNATEFARYEDTAFNGLDFILEVTVQKRSTTVLLCTSKLTVDGLSPEVKVEEISANFNAARDLVLSSTGAGAGDVVLKQFDLNYEKGTSNL